MTEELGASPKKKARKHLKEKARKRELHERARLQKEKLDCRMYRKQWPEVGDILLVEVKTMADHGAYCSLLEYNHLEGFILYSELQRKRIRSLKGVISEGRQEVVAVLRVNRAKGYIDLSRKRVTPEEKNRMLVNWNKSKAVHGVMRELATVLLLEHSVEELYKMFGWDLYDLFPPPRHAYDALKLAMADREKFNFIVQNHVVQSSDRKESEDATGDVKADDAAVVAESGEVAPKIPDKVAKALFGIIEHKLKPKLVTVRAHIVASCFGMHGVLGLRKALTAGITKCQELMAPEASDADLAQTESDSESRLSIQLVSAPKYTMTYDTYEPYEAIKMMNECIDAIHESIVSLGGTLEVSKPPHVASDTTTGITDYAPASDE